MKVHDVDLVIIDSNVRDQYYKDRDFHEKTNSYFGRFFDHLPHEKRPYYYISQLGFYEALGLGNLDILISSHKNLIDKLEATEAGSKEEATSLNEIFEELFLSYRRYISSDYRFKKKNISRRVFKQRSYIEDKELRAMYVRNLRRRFNNSTMVREFIDYLSLELMVDHVFSGVEPDRVVRFWLVTACKFLSDKRNNSFYRAILKIWLDGLMLTVKNSRRKGGFKNFHEDVLGKIRKHVSLKKGGRDLLDSEIIHKLVFGNFMSETIRYKFMVVTKDPKVSLLHRIAFYKSFLRTLTDFANELGDIIPSPNEGYICFADEDGYKIVNVADIPELFYFLEENPYSEFEKLLELVVKNIPMAKENF